MFHAELKRKMDELVHNVYRVTRDFPRDELYGSTSQLRRATLSVILNYIEGYARQRDAVLKNFLQISYGSLKESRYLIEFSCTEGFLSINDRDCLLATADEIGAMLWTTIKHVTHDM
jgi:four helix bundle protein